MWVPTPVVAAGLVSVSDSSESDPDSPPETFLLRLVSDIVLSENLKLYDF